MLRSMTDTIGLTPMHRVAHAALACLRQDGRNDTTVGLRSGVTATISYRGPALPERLSDGIADYETVRIQPATWGGTHRLAIRAPLVVLDVAWNENEAVRILTYCRGDWETGLMEALK